jgi:hypothetical protein
MPNKNKYVAGWRTAYTTPPIDTTSSHQPAAPSDKRETSTSPESPQDTQPPYPGMGKATIEVEPCQHLQALHADSVKKELESQREAYIRHMHCIQEGIERELSKGYTRNYLTHAEMRDWSDIFPDRKLPSTVVYVKSPHALNFPGGMCGAQSMTFILNKEYDAKKHAFRFLQCTSHNKLYGWTKKGKRRVIITSA